MGNKRGEVGNFELESPDIQIYGLNYAVLAQFLPAVRKLSLLSCSEVPGSVVKKRGRLGSGRVSRNSNLRTG